MKTAMSYAKIKFKQLQEERKTTVNRLCSAEKIADTKTQEICQADINRLDKHINFYQRVIDSS